MASSNVSSVTNHFANANEGFITTLSGSILSGATTVPLTAVSGLTNGDVFVGIIEPGLTKQQVFTGTVDTSGSQITGVVWTRGTNADHTAGVTIVDYVTGTGHNMMKKGILVAHDQTGVHKSGATYASPIFSGTATGTYTLAGTGTLTAPTITTPVLKTFDGWQTGSGTWTYASSTTFTVPAGDAAVMSVGTKIKLTQTTPKYFYVTGISGTTVTVTAGSDYTVANAAITAPYYSNETTPYNFPQWFNFTPTYVNLTVGAGVNEGRFAMQGKIVSLYVEWVFGAGAAVGSEAAIVPPVAVSSNYRSSGTYTAIGTALFLDSGSANLPGQLQVKGTGDLVLSCIRADATFAANNFLGSTTPMTWTTSDEIRASGTYEAA